MVESRPQAIISGSLEGVSMHCCFLLHSTGDSYMHSRISGQDQYPKFLKITFMF